MLYLADIISPVATRSIDHLQNLEITYLCLPGSRIWLYQVDQAAWTIGYRVESPWFILGFYMPCLWFLGNLLITSGTYCWFLTHCSYINLLELNYNGLYTRFAGVYARQAYQYIIVCLGETNACCWGSKNTLLSYAYIVRFLNVWKSFMDRSTT